MLSVVAVSRSRVFSSCTSVAIDFSTSKVLRLPKVVALATAGVAELVCKVSTSRAYTIVHGRPTCSAMYELWSNSVYALVLF